MTMDGDQLFFLIYDNKSEHRILIFVSSGDLSLWSSANLLWFMNDV